jgi:hypothetical protein
MSALAAALLALAVSADPAPAPTPRPAPRAAPAPAAKAPAAAPAPAACPDSGDTAFFESPLGFQGVRLLGEESYRATFPGKAFSTAAATAQTAAGRAEFWADKRLVQWQLVPAGVIKAPRGATEAQRLEAQADGELAYLKELVASGQARAGNVERFAPVEVKDAAGRARRFLIWKAVMGEQREATQYWITTPHPRGVVMLTLIAPTAEDAGVKPFIDGYLATYAPLDAAACAQVRAELSQGR